jgi:hypothetical protein
MIFSLFLDPESIKLHSIANIFEQISFSLFVQDILERRVRFKIRDFDL